MKTILLSLFFFTFSTPFAQSNWYNNFYNTTYDSYYVNGFELANGKTFIHTRANNQGQGMNSIGKLIDIDGAELHINDGGIGWTGIENSIYRRSGNFVWKLNQNFDTIQSTSTLPVGGWSDIHKAGNSLFFENSQSIGVLDTNLNQNWIHYFEASLPSYTVNSTNYLPEQQSVTQSGYQESSNEIYFNANYAHYNTSTWNPADSMTMDIFRFDKDSGALLDSTRHSFSMFIEPSQTIMFNNEILIYGLEFDSQWNFVAFKTIRIDANNNYSFINDNLQSSFEQMKPYFIGLNNQLYKFRADSIHALDNSLSTTNSFRLDLENDYRIANIDKVVNGYLIKVIDLTDSHVKFIRTDSNFYFNQCAGNTIHDEPYSVCLVTVENDLNKVIWQEESSTGNISGYNVYKESSNNTYELLDFVHIDSLSEYVDITSTPSVFPHKYKLSYVDSCLRESPITIDFHETIHLTSNLGTNDEVNLLWNVYTGTSYTTHYIYRGADAQSMELIDSVSSSVTSYTDFNAPTTGSLFYQIGITPESQCTSTKAIYDAILSNTKSAYETVSIDENFLFENRNLIQILDMMGRETTFKPNTPLIYVYDDGSTEKVFNVDY